MTRTGLKKRVAGTALKTLRSVGAFSLAAESQWRRNSLLILCYHGISLEDEHEWWPHLYITPRQFRERMQSLRRFGASVLPLGEALIRLKLNSLPPRSVCITFDDGFYDFLRHGVPILKEVGFPCTLYLTTHYCDYKLPIISLILDYLLWKSGRSAITLPQFGLMQNMPLATFADRQVAVKGLLQWAEQRNMNTVNKDELARQLATYLHIDYDLILQSRILQIMSPAEVQAAAKAGVDIQLHTHRHRTPKDPALFFQEIDENRKRIVDLTGVTPTHFCYPSGQYSPEFFGWLESSGVESATTCETGLAFRRSQSMKLPRVLDDSGMNLLRFESVMSGLFV